MLRIAAIGICRLHCEVRCDTPAAVYDGRCRGGQLNRCNLKRLAKGNGSQFHRSDIFHLVHNGSRLSRQVNPCFIQKAELSEIRIVSLHTNAQPNCDEDRVTGIHGSLHKVFCPVASHFMAAYPAVLHHDKSRTVKGIRRLDHAGFQSRSRRHDLKRRSRLIGVIDTAISPHGI